LRNPPYTPHIGPFYETRAATPATRTDEQRAVVEAMADYLASSGAAVVSLSLSRGITDCLPFYWRGWKVMPHYTYRIDLGQNEDALLAAMSTKRRNDVRKSKADRISVEESVDLSAMRALVIETFVRQMMSIPLATMDQIFSIFPPGDNSYCLISKLDGLPVAGVYVVHDMRTAYYLMGGYSDGAHHGAGALAMWHAILRAKELGLRVFDFEGSVIPPIERYFRGFGGRLTPCFTVNKAWLPLEMVLKLSSKYRNRF
jgi:lipid II:glycine glycyltransferase (peptidoglycan interpeptide bridge formation enzyme)